MGELLDKLEKLAESGDYAFHMPGHKRNIDFLNGICKSDITEIDGFDDLHKPTGVLKRLIDRVSKIYGADYSYILTGGSTSGILTAVSAATGKNDTILVARNSHKSVYNAVMLRDLKTEYVYPQSVFSGGINSAILAEDVEKHLAGNKKIKAVIITSPTYEGVVSDVKAIAAVCHCHNAVLIVDAAHGAHFGFSENFPANPVREGADIVIMSLHKTLPAMTQTAILCVRGNNINKDRLDMFFHTFISSSPSYVLMASVESCMDFLENNSEKFKSYEKKLENFYKECFLQKLCFFKTDDLGKIVVLTVNADISGKELKKILHNDFHIEVEMASDEYVIAMTSVCDSKESFDALSQALMEIDSKISFKDKKKSYEYTRGTAAVSICAAADSEYEYVSITEAVGRISAGFIMAYPPGIPVITPGEVFTKEICDKICYQADNNINLYGIDEKLYVKVCK